MADFTNTDKPIWYSATQGNEHTDLVHIQWVKWIGATSAGHKCQLQDQDGAYVFSDEASDANYVAFQPVGAAYRGLVLNDLDSGHVLIRVGE